MQVCTVGGAECMQDDCREGWRGREERSEDLYRKDAFPGYKDAILPWRVGSSNEEVDDHPITHVETMLHCSVGGKRSGQGLNLQTVSMGYLQGHSACFICPGHSQLVLQSRSSSNDRKPQEKLCSFRSYT